jgi:hypothetical protein
MLAFLDREGVPILVSCVRRFVCFIKAVVRNNSNSPCLYQVIGESYDVQQGGLDRKFGRPHEAKRGNVVKNLVPTPRSS